MSPDRETAGQQLARMGTDAHKWAREFMNMHHSRGGLNSDVDEELMIGWFASAIETGRTAGQQRFTADRWAALANLPPTTHVVLTQREWSFLALEARRQAEQQMDPRNYAAGPHPDGGQTLNPEWLTRQERYDRWIAIAEILEHGTPIRPVTYGGPTETAGQLQEGDVLRDSAGRFYQVGSEARASDFRSEDRDAVARQRYLEIFSDEYSIIPGAPNGDNGVAWPLVLVWRPEG